MTDKASLGAALGRVPSGVFVLAVRDGGTIQTLLGSWLQQANFEPPMVTVAIQRERAMLQALERSKVVAVSVLPENSGSLLARFARPRPDAFDGVEVVETPGGQPALKEATAWFEGRLVSTAPAGDHVICVLELTAGEVLRQDVPPRVHLRKSGFTY